jgi:hypothetical protein
VGEHVHQVFSSKIQENQIHQHIRHQAGPTATEPNELFLSHEFDGKRLLHDRVMNAWAGDYVFYGGPGWRKPEIIVCLDILNGVPKPNNWWEKMDLEDINKISLFRPSEIVSDNVSSMHDKEHHLRIESIWY